MIPKALDKIDRADIDSLIANAVEEGRTIEYKQALPGNADKDKKEFLADVSSFANASGGDIYFGIDEKRDADGKTTGLPERAAGLPNLNADQEIRRLENMIRDGIRPRIAGVQLRTVDGFADGPVLVIRIQKSYVSPHMVTFQDHSRFYSRNSRGKYPLDVGEIRSAFALSESLPERIRNFRNDRIARIVADETPVPLPSRHVRFVLHSVPMSAFQTMNHVELRLVGQNSQRLWPLGALGFDMRFNLDGLVTYSGVGQNRACTSYAQLFRNGAIEAVEGGMCQISTREGQSLRFDYFEGQFRKSLPPYLDLQRELELVPPIVVMLSIIGAKGFAIARSADGFANRHSIDRDVLLLPDQLVDGFARPIDQILRPIFDAVWQSAGWPGSPSFNKDGKWSSDA